MYIYIYLSTILYIYIIKKYTHHINNLDKCSNKNKKISRQLKNFVL